MRQDSNQLPLPFREREYIDFKRAMSILGVSHPTVSSLHRQGLINIIDYRKRSRKRVQYASLVEYCDTLRIRFCIKDRRPPLASNLMRHRDEDLLPFPLADTIGIEDTFEFVGYESKPPIIAMIEEGCFEAYQLMWGSTWRVSRLSFFAYVQNAREGARNQMNLKHLRAL